MHAQLILALYVLLCVSKPSLQVAYCALKFPNNNCSCGAGRINSTCNSNSGVMKL